MTTNNKIWRIIPLTFFGSWFTYKLYKSATEDLIFDGIIFLIIGIVGLSIFIWTIRKDFQEYKQLKSLSSFLPTMTGLIFIFIISGLHFFQKSKINSPTLISAYYDGDYNGFSIDLKENGNYIMASGSPLGQSYYYGTYTIKDSIVTLDKSNIGKVLTTEKLVIRTITKNLKQNANDGKDTTKREFLYQIDKNGKVSDTYFYFRVTEDNREKQKNSMK